MSKQKAQELAKTTTLAQIQGQPIVSSTAVAEGDTCTTPDGRSGYMVGCGDKFVCVAS